MKADVFHESEASVCEFFVWFSFSGGDTLLVETL